MKNFLRGLLLLACAASSLASAQESTAPPALEIEQPADTDVEAAQPSAPAQSHRSERDVILQMHGNSVLAARESADAVISIIGSSTSAGATHESVVSVVGDTHVTGPTGADVVAVLGNTYVNSNVGGDVVAAFGNAELGPQAEVHGDVVVIGGTLTRAPGAVVHGKVEEIGFAGSNGDFTRLRPWVENCLLLGRPLSLDPGVGWAWTLAFGFLGLYILVALLFAESVEHCARTIETRPGRTLIASLLLLIGIPAFLVALLITFIGIPLVPFVIFALLVMSLFGKVVVLAAIGRRLTRFTGIAPLSDIAFSVLVGGAAVLALYMVPLLGFIAYNVLGLLGLGTVIYTLVLHTQEKRAAAAAKVASTAAPATTAASAKPATAAASTEPPDPAAAAASAETVTVPPSLQAELPRADFWIRMGALFIDAVILAVALQFLHEADNALLPALAVYGAIMWKVRGTTVGGIVCNLRVVRLDGAEMGWNTAIVRALGCLLSAAPFGLGFLWIAFDKDRQAWHDKIAGTVVVRVPKGVALI